MDKKHKGIFDRLMRVTPSIFCPSGKKVTGLCTSLNVLTLSDALIKNVLHVVSKSTKNVSLYRSIKLLL